MVHPHVPVLDFLLVGLRDIYARRKAGALRWQRENPVVFARSQKVGRERVKAKRAAEREALAAQRITSFVGQPLPVVCFILDGTLAFCERKLAQGREFTREWEKRNAVRRAAYRQQVALEARRATAERREAARPRPESWPPRVWIWFAGAVEHERKAQSLRKRRVWANLTPAQRADRAQKKREWRKSNPGLHRLHKKQWRDRRRAQRRPRDLMETACRSRLYDAVTCQGGYRSEKTKTLLGCEYEFLTAHLENKFRDGMSWENYGKHWHVDHIKPCSKFDLTQLEEQRKCFHFTNLQPLLGPENIAKSDYYEEPDARAA
jgi:hypothetical protein